MTKPTQAQIEAGLAVFADHYWDSFNADKFLILQHIKETLPRALTAAADEKQERNFSEEMAAIWSDDKVQDRIIHHGREVMRSTIERCAQVVNEWKGFVKDRNGLLAAIRALKDKPQPDPNIIHPGKDLTNVFPEEEP